MLTCLVIKCVNVSALCHTKQHSGCQCHEESAGFVLFLPFSRSSNCSPVFLRKSNVQLQERRQNPLLRNTKAGRRKEKLGQPFTLLDANFHAKHPPCGWAFPCDGLRAHGLPLATCCGVSRRLFHCWLGGTGSPRSYGSAQLAICTTTKPLTQNSPAKKSCRSNKRHECKLSACWGVAGC